MFERRKTITPLTPLPSSLSRIGVTAVPLFITPFSYVRCSTRGRPHLKAEAAAVEAALVHGRVLADEALAQAALVVEEKVTVVVVVQHAPRQVHEGAQLAQGVAVGLHLAGVVRQPEEDAAAVGGDVAALLDDVEEAASHHLQRISEFSTISGAH